MGNRYCKICSVFWIHFWILGVWYPFWLVSFFKLHTKYSLLLQVSRIRQDIQNKIGTSFIGLAANRHWSHLHCSCWHLVSVWPSLSTSSCSASCVSLKASPWQASSFRYIFSVSVYPSTQSSPFFVIVTTPVQLFTVVQHIWGYVWVVRVSYDGLMTCPVCIPAWLPW